MFKKNPFQWCSAALVAFEKLKKAMSNIPILALTNFIKPFILEIVQVSLVLEQNGRPIAFLSKALPLRKLGLSTYE